MDIDAGMMKKGETVTRVRFQRSSVGLKITCWAHPQVEELMRSWGSGEIQPIDVHGRMWYIKKGHELRGVYHLGSNPGVCPFDGGYYRIDRAGQPFICGEGEVNLSFMRIAGVSEGEGVTFEVKGVHELDKIRSLAESIKMATRRFYINYLKPIDLHVMVSTQEMRT